MLKYNVSEISRIDEMNEWMNLHCYKATVITFTSVAHFLCLHFHAPCYKAPILPLLLLLHLQASNLQSTFAKDLTFLRFCFMCLGGYPPWILALQPASQCQAHEGKNLVEHLLFVPNWAPEHARWNKQYQNKECLYSPNTILVA